MKGCIYSEGNKSFNILFENPKITFFKYENLEMQIPKYIDIINTYSF